MKRFTTILLFALLSNTTFCQNSWEEYRKERQQDSLLVFSADGTSMTGIYSDEDSNYVHLIEDGRILKFYIIGDKRTKCFGADLRSSAEITTVDVRYADPGYSGPEWWCDATVKGYTINIEPIKYAESFSVTINSPKCSTKITRVYTRLHL